MSHVDNLDAENKDSAPNGEEGAAPAEQATPSPAETPVSEPVAPTDEPAATADEPAATADEPAATADEPAAAADEPAAAADEPAATADEPAATADEPKADEAKAKGDAKGKSDKPAEGKGGRGRPSERDAMYQAFTTELESIDEIGTKLQKTIEFMEASLSQKGSPNFKNFWEARRVCLELFKENVNPVLRALLWEKYTELSTEARRLKQILDEQSAFAVEQIEIAVAGLESDIAGIADQVEKLPAVDFKVKCSAIQKNLSKYSALQKELNLLNAFATRVNALRKELIKTEMRIRFKNKFFQRLSAAGDKVFPHRKELVKAVGELYHADVKRFAELCGKKEEVAKQVHHYREEIKSLQAIAKTLTLNTKAFSQTRQMLSKCWDIVKELDKDRRKEWGAQREESRKNAEELKTEIAAFSEEYAKGEMSTKQGLNKIDEISTKMRNTQLGRDEVKMLRDTLGAAKKPVLEQSRAEEDERKAKRREEEAKAAARKQELREQLEALIVDATDAEALEAKCEEFKSELGKLSNARAERMDLDRLFKAAKDKAIELREEALLSLSDDAKERLVSLKKVLHQRNDRRQEIRSSLEALRKAAGGSGLDFEQAMANQEAIGEERVRLEKATAGIEEIEREIKQLGN